MLRSDPSAGWISSEVHSVQLDSEDAEDAFEVVSSWTTQGFWNRSRLQGIRNAAVPTYVRLAPGDASNGALPAASEGAYAFWYGQASSGNFMGLQVPTDLEGSGGTSQLPNAGSLTSPVLHIPSTASTASPVRSLDGQLASGSVTSSNSQSSVASRRR